MPVSQPLDLARLRSALREEGSPWQMSQTSMTVLTEEERVVRLGVPLDEIDLAAVEQDQEAAAAAVASAEAVGAPTAFDLRNVGGANYSTPVKDQGGCGSCVAFGVAGAMEGVARYTRRTPNLPLDFSEAHLFYCYARAAGFRCNTGWWPDLALNAARDTGVAFEDYFPYTAGDQACAVNADWPNRMGKVAGVAGLAGNPAGMKEHISTYGSISACFVVFQDFYSYRSGVYRHVSGEAAGGHCVTLIGYDDGQGCWIAKNSWGTGWGDSGYFKIAYGQCSIENYANRSPNGVQAVNLRAWLPNQQIVGLWANEADNNVWAYGSLRGWLKLDGIASPTGQAMLTDLAAAKAASRPVGLFESNGVVEQLYA